jgi:hypothetical protein
MTPRELRDALEKSQAENVSMRRRLEAAERKLEKTTALLDAARLENDRLASLWVKQHVNPQDQRPAFDVQRLMAYLKQGK